MATIETKDLIKFAEFLDKAKAVYPEIDSKSVALFYVANGDKFALLVEMYETKSGFFYGEPTFKSLTLREVLFSDFTTYALKDLWNDFVDSINKLSTSYDYLYDREDANDMWHLRNMCDHADELIYSLPNRIAMWNENGSKLVNVDVRKLLITNWSDILQQIIAYPKDFDGMYEKVIYPSLCTLYKFEKKY